jgi:hypothetical protein
MKQQILEAKLRAIQKHLRIIDEIINKTNFKEDDYYEEV